MAKGVKVSQKYGVNPVIPICFWCGKERNEVALMGEVRNKDGEEIEMPMHACIDYEPCEDCKAFMAQGFTVIEATTEPNPATSESIQKGVYPTGTWSVVTNEAAERIFAGLDTSRGKAFIDPEGYELLFGKG